jgi:hypothetical protein
MMVLYKAKIEHNDEDFAHTPNEACNRDICAVYSHTLISSSGHFLP